MYIGKTHLHHATADIFSGAGILLVYVNEMPQLWTGIRFLHIWSFGLLDSDHILRFRLERYLKKDGANLIM